MNGLKKTVSFSARMEAWTFAYFGEKLAASSSDIEEVSCADCDPDIILQRSVQL